MEVIYGCGFNRFSQLSCLEGPSVEHHKSSNTTTDAVNYLLLGQMCQLPSNQKLHNVVFTWDRIASTFIVQNQTKDKKLFTSVSGLSHREGEQSSEDHTKQIYFTTLHDKNAIASNDTDILLTDASQPQRRFLIQRDNVEEVHISSKGDQQAHSKSTEVVCLSGGHREFYCIYDNISLGRLSFQCGGRNNKESMEYVLSVPLRHIDCSNRICAISCGKEHVLLLNELHSIYTYGLGSRGQLGHSTVESESSPRLVEALEGVPISAIAAGGWHSAVVSESGDVYTWGWNESGQLGVASKIRESSQDEVVGVQPEPRVIDLPTDGNVVSVACGSRHTLCLTENGTAMSTGWNCYGQLGHDHVLSLDKFTIIERISNITKIFAGQWNSVFVCEKDTSIV